MKWYFACNDKSPDFYPLIKAAVNSALENTTLVPHFIYDGEENELTQWLEKKGVKIIHHRVSFYAALKSHYNEHLLNIASGAFLRCDIPVIEKEDDFVLYTDCDVLFLKDFKTDLKPEYLACSTQFDKKNFRDFNTGVMLMNVKKLRESHEKFSKFIVKNLNVLNTFDQTAYQIFYGGKNRGKYSRLPIRFNHKPYWGLDESAVILHFHGAKPTAFESDESLKHLPYVHYKLYKQNPSAYDFFLELFKKYYPAIEYNEDAIQKVKSDIYPLVKTSATPFILKLKRRFLKEFKTIVNIFNK